MTRDSKGRTWGSRALVALGVVATALATSEHAQMAQSQRSPVADHDYKHDVSPRLRDIPPKPYVGRQEHEANPNPRRVTQHRNQTDSVVQSNLAQTAMPSPQLNFDGVKFPGVNCNCAPPDTNGEVGATQYTQIVNEGLQIFDKTSGASQLGPIGISTLWSGFGGVCETAGSGDPVILYDQLADRWVISQFAGTSVPTDECIAVSKTPDATGQFYRYAFHLGSNFFDYPKLAVWPDAYYMSMNVFNSSGTAYLGPQPFAFDRSNMLQGLGATFVTTGITGGSGEEAYLPADLDGKALPPAGAPNSFVEFPGAADQYKVYHFHVDFAVPGNSTFTLFSSPASAAYTELCATTRSCVPQAGTTSRLDGIGDRLMFRAGYRNFGDHEAVVTNYSVNSGGVAGVRWLELRNVTYGPVTVFQESTYQPDSTWRWMGSVAMDGSGDLAVGFSASSGSIFPQIRYAGRLATDPLNSLAQGETTLFSGSGSQTGTSSRWGDYSSITVDPVDDCTFWYTTEYYSTTSSFNWRTRIGSFKYSQCTGSGGSAPSLAIAKTADAATVSSGSQIGFTVTVSNNGTGDATGVSVNDVLPAGTNISWAIGSGSGWSIAGSPPNQTLTYGPATLAAGASVSAHVVSATTSQSCGTYNNTASFNSTNGGSGSSSTASIAVTCASAPTAVITTASACTSFTGGTATPLSSISYGVKPNQTINAINPSGFYYWVAVNAVAGNNSFVIPQTITSTNFSTLFQLTTSSVFNSACSSAGLTPTFTQTNTNSTSGTVTAAWNAPSAGIYYIGLHLSGNSLNKKPAPSPTTTVTYTFSTNGVSNSSAGVALVKN